MTKFKILSYMFENSGRHLTSAEIAEGAGVPLSSVYKNMRDVGRLFTRKMKIAESGRKETEYQMRDKVYLAEKAARDRNMSMFSILLTDNGYASVYGKKI